MIMFGFCCNSVCSVVVNVSFVLLVILIWLILLSWILVGFLIV